jgi:hypothetical protein
MQVTERPTVFGHRPDRALGSKRLDSTRIVRKRRHTGQLEDDHIAGATRPSKYVTFRAKPKRSIPLLLE